jgi:hypothetical protein
MAASEVLPGRWVIAPDFHIRIAKTDGKGLPFMGSSGYELLTSIPWFTLPYAAD